MHTRIAAMMVGFLLIPIFLSGCSRGAEGDGRPRKSPPETFSLSLSQIEYDIYINRDFIIVEGACPPGFNPHFAVIVSPEQVEAIMAALDKCKAMTRQDGYPPGMPASGWSLSLVMTRKNGEKAHGYWHLGREVDITLPAPQRDIFQAVFESLTGAARKQVDDYCMDVHNRSGAVARAKQAGTAPAETFSVESSCAQGRIVLYLIGKTSGMEVVWSLPAEITGRTEGYVVPGGGGPLVSLYQGADMASYLAPRGAARPPRQHEEALSGALICEPKSERTVSISLQGMRFPSRRIEAIGPVDVQLDLPAPP